LKQNPLPESAAVDVACHQMTDDMRRNLIYYGESVPSLRPPLLRRYTLNNSQVYNPAASTSIELWLTCQNDYPLYYGYDVVANALCVTSSSKHVNYAHNSLMNYLMPAFAAVRGSVRSKYAVKASQNNVVDLQLSRAYSDTGFNYPLTNSFSAGAAASQVAFARSTRTGRTSYAEGSAYTAASKQPILEAELPFYRPVRFACGYAMDSTKPYCPNSMSHKLEVTTTGSTLPVVVDRFVAAGEDFNLIWFQGAPPMTTMAAPAA